MNASCLWISSWLIPAAHEAKTGDVFGLIEVESYPGLLCARSGVPLVFLVGVRKQNLVRGVSLSWAARSAELIFHCRCFRIDGVQPHNLGHIGVRRHATGTATIDQWLLEIPESALMLSGGHRVGLGGWEEDVWDVLLLFI